ncbi:hypothetical protein ACJX0J_016913, partial [Zea mays]
TVRGQSGVHTSACALAASYGGSGWCLDAWSLTDKGSDEVVFKAMGRAINKTVMVVELIKRRIVGLHQNTTTGSTDITDMWEPLEEGLLPLETTRHVSMITITLSKKELDTSSIGRHPHALTLRESPAAPQAPRSPPFAILFAFFPPPNAPLPRHRSFSRLLRRIPRPHHSRGLAQASPLPSTASQSRASSRFSRPALSPPCWHPPEAPAGTPSIWVQEGRRPVIELELLSDGANVYKLIGPVLVKHDLAETKANVKKRIEYISAELKRMDRALKDLEEKQNNKKESDVRIPYQQKRMFGFVTFMYAETVKAILSKATRTSCATCACSSSPTRRRARKLQHAHHGGAEFAGCASPTGLLDSRDPYALLLLSGAQ